LLWERSNERRCGDAANSRFNASAASGDNALWLWQCCVMIDCDCIEKSEFYLRSIDVKDRFSSTSGADISLSDIAYCWSTYWEKRFFHFLNRKFNNYQSGSDQFERTIIQTNARQRQWTQYQMMIQSTINLHKRNACVWCREQEETKQSSVRWRARQVMEWDDVWRTDDDSWAVLRAVVTWLAPQPIDVVPIQTLVMISKHNNHSLVSLLVVDRVAMVDVVFLWAMSVFSDRRRQSNNSPTTIRQFLQPASNLRCADVNAKTVVPRPTHSGNVASTRGLVSRSLYACSTFVSWRARRRRCCVLDVRRLWHATSTHRHSLSTTLTAKQ